MKFFDTNVAFGEWPFGTAGITSARRLRDHLDACSIEMALVSHLATIFNPEPDHGNQRLFRALKNEEQLIPVPVINPTLPDWRECLDRYRDRHVIKAIKVFPNFHRFQLAAPPMDDLVAYVRKHEIRPIINIRMVDERHQYFGLNIQGVSVKSLTDFSNRHDDLKFLCLGLYRPEILELADRCGNFLTDFSFADWQYLIEELLGCLPVERILFGSHTPLMVTRSNTDQLRCADISQTRIRKIGRDNAVKFFGL